MKNHLGSYECKLCLTLHNNEVRICVSLDNVLLLVLMVVDQFEDFYSSHSD